MFANRYFTCVFSCTAYCLLRSLVQQPPILARAMGDGLACWRLGFEGVGRIDGNFGAKSRKKPKVRKANPQLPVAASGAVRISNNLPSAAWRVALLASSPAGSEMVVVMRAPLGSALGLPALASARRPSVAVRSSASRTGRPSRGVMIRRADSLSLAAQRGGIVRVQSSAAAVDWCGFFHSRCRALRRTAPCPPPKHLSSCRRVCQANLLRAALKPTL